MGPSANAGWAVRYIDSRKMSIPSLSLKSYLSPLVQKSPIKRLKQPFSEITSNTTLAGEAKAKI